MIHENKVRQYYSDSNESYEGFYGGRCHFGFTPDSDTRPYNLKVAQRNMQHKLGDTLDLPSGSNVLDAGCGFGPVARTLTQDYDLQVTGIDLMPNRLQHAQKTNTRRGLNSIKLAEADYHNLPFRDNAFDGVCTMETFVHANPLEVPLEEFYRVLKPGGRLVLFEYSIPAERDINPFIRPVAMNLAGRVIKRTAMTSLPRFTHGSFPGHLKNAGFENIEVEDISRNVWPTWRHLWYTALKNTGNQIIHGQFSLNTLQGTTLVYPARHQIKYNVCSANKPLHH